ncbi:hypothetical protein H9N25_18565 [Pedobacter riviphilus]|uniref:Uncharacterized protein n=1 Tax=Pedobacter riviphilus TaxID=2766984 RepID=A0ABX6TL30_9SPHI|nr:hypothetical protein [Pedobacter riviphilus]QNR83910.1 hypothetical protein H9N25_18565 [Pedobacter riviphilus]
MIKFLFLLAIELVFSPVLYLKEFFSRYISIPDPKRSYREPILNDIVIAGLHDWVGYEMTRKKVVNDIEFDCGLKYQLDRLAKYKGPKRIKMNITISGSAQDSYDKYRDIDFQEVSNVGMDFQGYGQTVRKYFEHDNCYVLLMNSSIDSKHVDFLDDYINFLEQNPTVGMIGISYSTKIYQTLIRNNFTPHIQSFFLLTSLDVLKKVVENNGGNFPGQNISYKRLLIRFGEVKLSRMISKMGYDLAIVTEDGLPFIFPKSNSLFETSYKKWKLPKGEYRFQTSHPNRINPLLTLAKDFSGCTNNII